MTSFKQYKRYKVKQYKEQFKKEILYGYDDIYMDGDYDYDRYNKYADGVDDAGAMDEFGW